MGPPSESAECTSTTSSRPRSEPRDGAENGRSPTTAKKSARWTSWTISKETLPLTGFHLEKQPPVPTPSKTKTGTVTIPRANMPLALSTPPETGKSREPSRTSTPSSGATEPDGTKFLPTTETGRDTPPLESEEPLPPVPPDTSWTRSSSTRLQRRTNATTSSSWTDPPRWP